MNIDDVIRSAQIPGVFKQLNKTDLKKLKSLVDSKEYSVIGKILEVEIETIKNAAINEEPGENVRADEFNRGKRKGRKECLEFFTNLLGYVEEEIKLREKDNLT